MIVLERGLVLVSVRAGKCEACSESRLGLCFHGAADCPLLICAHCLADATFQALPALARELAQWRGRRRAS